VITLETVFLAHIESNLSQLHPTERKVARYILNHPQETVYLSVAELAERAGVSTATVIRLSQALGCQGYYHLKMSLMKSLATTPHTYVDEDIDLSDDLHTAVNKVFEQSINSLKNASQLLDVEQLQRAVTLLSEADKIAISGVGTSGIAAQDLNYKLIRLGLPTQHYIDSHIQLITCCGLSEQSAVVAISHSGSTHEVVEVARLAKEMGASVIALTHHTRSPLTTYADVILRTASPETPFTSGKISSIMVQMAVIDCICIGVTLVLGERAIQHAEKTAEAVKSTKY